MTTLTGKRELPRRPHPDHLRKQAKARLAEMRAFRPDACLADAQRVLAQEYGFSSWGKLQAEACLRAATVHDRRVRARRRRIPPTVRFFRERQLQDVPDTLVEQAAPFEPQTAFFLSGACTNVGVLLVSIVVLMSVWALLFGITG